MPNELANLYSQGAHEVSSFYGPITLFSKDAPFISKLDELCEKDSSLRPFIESRVNEFFSFFIGVDLDTEKFIFLDALLPHILQKITENS